MNPVPLFLAILASTQVDLTLSPPAQAVPACGVAQVDVVLSANSAVSLAAVDVIVSWDPDELELIQAIPSAAGWLIADFLNDPDGINDDLTDGEALFTALASPSAPVSLPPDVVVATFEFRPLHDGQVTVLPSLGTFGKTQVVSAIPSMPVTVTLTGPASITTIGFPSVEISNPGTPPNPDVLLPGVTSGPVIGSTWDPVIDHTSFVPDALVDLIFLTAVPVEVTLPPYGTLLCSIATPPLFFTTTPGTPFALNIPNDCKHIGQTPCVQAASINGTGVILLTNALDIVIGTM